MHISSTKTSHIALVVAFTLYFVTLYLAFTNPIQPPKPENHTYIKGPVTITGYLTHQPFTGRQYTSAEAAHGEPIFAESLYLAVAKNQTEAASQFFLFNRAFNGTIWEVARAGYNLNSQLGGLTMQEITGAYTSMCQVTVKGNAFTLYRINGTYQCIDVESIEIHGREHAPLIVNMWHDNNKYGFYSSGQWSSGWNDAEFTYVEPSDYLNSTLFFRVTLSGGDAVRFAADSYQPFSVRVHASVGSNSTEFMRVLGSVLYEFENVTSIYREFTADARGEYSFSFYVGYRIDDDFLVDFRIGRVDDSK